MSAYNGRRVFRASGWLIGLFVGVELLFIAGSWFGLRTQPWSLGTIVFTGMAVVGLLAILEALVARVELGEDALRIATLWSRRSYARGEIRRATYAKGAPMSLELAEGGWVKLPNVGPNAQSVTNSIRAWLKADA